ncbi:hypothetical protein E4U41_003635 [Claviceps citrina]|nr:hypothetical protein E4U41_003635 [Claviceps citrina]
MSSILASLFTPRKAALGSDVASSLLDDDESALSTRKARRKSLPERRTRRSVAFPVDIPSHGPPPTPSKPTQTITSAASTGEPPDQSVVAQEPAAHDDVVDRVAPTEPPPTDEPPPHAEVEAEYAFEQLTDHRWAGTSAEIQVMWEVGSSTWEPEAALHEDAPDALLAYWASQGGRPANPNEPDLFEVHAIRKHSRDGKKLLVEWVGFGPGEASWVPRAVVEETAPEVVAEYWRSVRGARPGRRRGRRGKRW